ncbi:hypothetical protein SARC_00309 [Sphaeroforma arctica JP610]|uniref:Uncharacterized protein n=1 Tax=Sphaeroforma arctica JP610 TaxID=667725 RepID=A0A0L0GFI6_9EUKA|nr:hypothetical protein SARC_00309 [Sphaeroforma arctica JP610]KNC87609.1 hypothetical protein SARC_00309 [Sphaeroforma arctica JP610]|eukprot:XP_014161511.1 hypothetical protein SARC_00309 [Sphaeroforma arctica JP610]
MQKGLHGKRHYQRSPPLSAAFHLESIKLKKPHRYLAEIIEAQISGNEHNYNHSAITSHKDESCGGLRAAGSVAPPPFILNGQRWRLSTYYNEDHATAMAEYLPTGETRDNWTEMIVSMIEPKQDKSLRRHMKDLWVATKSQRAVLYWQVIEESATELMFEYSLDYGSEYHLYRMTEKNDLVTIYCYSRRLKENPQREQTAELAANEATRLQWTDTLKAVPLDEDPSSTV